MHKIRTLFLSRNITGLERWRGWPWLRALLLGTADDFSNLNVLLQNLRCWKKKLFSFPTQQILARSVKKRRSYRSSKSSGLQTNLSPSLREKIRFDGTSGLIFHPDNGSFAYTCTGMSPTVIHITGACMAVQRSSRFASFRLAVLTSTGPLFWFVWTEHERTHALKDHDWNDFVKLLQWANFHGIRCSCCPCIRIRTQGWVVVNFGVVVLGSKTNGLVGPTTATQVHEPVSPAQPVAWISKILWCEDFSGSAEVLCWPKKVASRHDKQAETDLAIQFAWRR